MAQDSPTYTPPSRQGKTLIGGHFDPDIKRQLKIIAAENETSVQSLIEEAITDLIKKKNKG
jgi:predicted HicB family RNase H-like nuclease